MQKRLVSMMLIGIGIGAVGLAVHMAMDAPMLLILSLILAVGCLLKVFLLGRAILKKQYIIMEGRCVSTASLPFSRFAQVVLRGDDGEEHLPTGKKNEDTGWTAVDALFCCVAAMWIRCYRHRCRSRRTD